MVLEQTREPWFFVKKEKRKRPFDVIAVERRIQSTGIGVFHIYEFIFLAKILYRVLTRSITLGSTKFDILEDEVEFSIEHLADMRARKCNLMVQLLKRCRVRQAGYC